MTCTEPLSALTALLDEGNVVVLAASVDGTKAVQTRRIKEKLNQPSFLGPNLPVVLYSNKRINKGGGKENERIYNERDVKQCNMYVSVLKCTLNLVTAEHFPLAIALAMLSPLCVQYCECGHRRTKALELPN